MENKNESLFKAVSSGTDLELLKRCLNGSTKESLLEFEQQYDESPLHVAIKSKNEWQEEKIKCIVEYTEVDYDSRDSANRTPLECALIYCSPQLVRTIMRSEIKRLGEERTIYNVVKRRSLKLCKILLEVLNDCAAQNVVFQSLVNAFVELSVKQVTIAEDAELYLMEWMSRFAYTRGHGNGSHTKVPDRWSEHLGIVLDMWKYISNNYGTESFDGIDSALMQRLQIIHSHLYSIRNQHQLKHLPLHELLFCLATFICIFKRNAEFETYKLVLNKKIILKTLGAVCGHLSVISAKLTDIEMCLVEASTAVQTNGMVDRDNLLRSLRNDHGCAEIAENLADKLIRKLHNRKIHGESVAETVPFDFGNLLTPHQRQSLKSLKKSYNIARQLYSLTKILAQLDAAFSSETLPATVRVHCVKRVLQVTGESLKSTSQSPNMSKRVLKLQGTLMSKTFANDLISFREYLSHQLSYHMLLLNPSDEMRIFNVSDTHLVQLQALYSLMRLVSTYECSDSFSQTILQCKTMKEVNALLQYTGSLEEIEWAQVVAGRKLRRYFAEQASTTGSTETPWLLAFNEKMEKFASRICERPEYKSFFTLEDFRRCCKSGASLATVKKLAIHKINTLRAALVFEEHEQIWRTLTMDPRQSYAYANPNHPYGMTVALLAMKTMIPPFQGDSYLPLTKRMLVELGLADPDDEQVANLNLMLSKYYQNIFRIDLKYQEISNFFKRYDLKCDELHLKGMRQKDEAVLQSIFEDRVGQLRSMLQHHNCDTVELLVQNEAQIQLATVAALEQCQLEMCEMLTAVGYFTQNFISILHRVPMIQGREYRNYLAHDCLNYNLLTDNWQRKSIINAVVMSSASIALFRKSTSKQASSSFSSPSIGTIVDWMDVQRLLYGATVDNDFEAIRRWKSAGAAIEAHFFTTDTSHTVQISSLIDYERSDSNSLAFLKRYLPDCDNHACMMMAALHWKQYPAAFSAFVTSDGEWPPEGLFHWSDLVSNLCKVNLLQKLNATKLLCQLIVHANERSIADLLRLYDRVPEYTKDDLLVGMEINYNPSKRRLEADYINEWACRLRNPMDLAVLCGASAKVVAMLLEKHATVSNVALMFAIYTHDQEMFVQLANAVARERFYLQDYLMIAIECRALNIVQWLMINVYAKSFLIDNLASYVIYATRNGQPKIIECLAKHLGAQFSTTNHGKAAILAVQYQTWSCLRLLVELGVSIDATQEVSVFTKTTPFLRLVKLGAFRLIRHLPKANPCIYKRNVHFSNPLAIALECGNEKMFRYLRGNRFEYLDNSQTLHAAINSHRTDVIDDIFAALADRENKWQTVSDAKMAFVLQVLLKWLTLGYVEEPSCNNETALQKAALADKLCLVEKLLALSRNSRAIENEGNVNEIGFYAKATTQWIKETKQEKFSSLIISCEQIIANIMHVDQSIRLNWTESIVETRDTVMQLYSSVTPTNAITHDNCSLDASTLATTLDSVLNICQTAVPDSIDLIVYAVIHQPGACKYYFLKIFDHVCIFDLLSPKSMIRLDSYVNYNAANMISPLWISVSKSDVHSVKLLLANGADPTIECVREQATALHAAILHKNPTMITTLFEHCADHKITTLKKLAASLITCAIIHNDERSVSLLLKHRVNLNVSDPECRTITMYCIIYNRVDVLRTLLAYDPVQLHKRDKRQNSLLHYSAKFSSHSLEVLLPLGLDFTAENLCGNTPVDVAILGKQVAWLKKVVSHAKGQPKRVFSSAVYSEIRELAIAVHDDELLELSDAPVFVRKTQAKRKKNKRRH